MDHADLDRTRAAGTDGVKRILVGVDAAEESVTALRWAEDLADQVGADLVVHVANPDDGCERVPSPGRPDPWPTLAESAAVEGADLVVLSVHRLDASCLAAMRDAAQPVVLVP